MKKILSYFWPLKSRFHSKFSGWLEITWLNGKKLLNSKNTNYSYGSLQKVLRYGLSEVKFRPDDKVLLLGMGGGSIIKVLREEYKHKGQIAAVEIDPVVIEVAEKEFGIRALKDLKIIHADALSYVQNTNESFKLIIIDLFIDKNVPEECFSVDFWEKISKLSEPKAQIIFNAGMDLTSDQKIREIISKQERHFDFILLENVMGRNTLLLALKKMVNV